MNAIENGKRSSNGSEYQLTVEQNGITILTKDMHSKEIIDSDIQKMYTKKKLICDKIPARLVLYFLSWSGFLVSFMMRNDINLALVAMIRKNMTTDFNSNNTQSSDEEDMGEFDWSPAIKAAILGSFYWCYVLSQVAGGIATQHFGTKNVFGWSQFATAACSLCIPFAANIHYGAVIFLRSVQGFASGLTWPAMYAIVCYWIPPVERSRFMSSFQGFSFGIGLTYPLCGFIIKQFGWKYVFYTTGTIGMLWCVMWYFLAYNTPGEHPRISKAELEYIQVNVDPVIKEGHGKNVPWKSIFLSLPAWSIGVTTFGRIWIHYQFIISGPSYMKYILGFDIQSNGLLSGTPFLCSYVSSVFFCYIADLLVQYNLVSLTNIRKLFTVISQIIPGLMLLGVSFIDNENLVIILIIWYVAVTLITASYAGAMANIVDIAPNLAGPVLAFAQTIHMSASFLSPVVTGFMIKHEDSIEEWRQVFGLAAIIAVITYIMFQIYGTADVQPWNYPPKKLKPPEESQMLTNKTENEKIVK